MAASIVRSCRMNLETKRSKQVMISKHLAVAAAIFFLAGAAGGTAAFAQATPPATTAAPAGAPATTPAPAPAAATPAPAAPAPAAIDTGAPKANPYGLMNMWTTGDLVLKT